MIEDDGFNPAGSGPVRGELKVREFVTVELKLGLLPFQDNNLMREIRITNESDAAKWIDPQLGFARFTRDFDK